MLNSIQKDLRELIDLVRVTATYDATLMASHNAGKPIEPQPQAQLEHDRQVQRIRQLREKYDL